MKERENRGHPFLDFVWSVVSPIFSLWSFLGMVPYLVYGMFALAAVMVMIQVFRLFLRR